MLACVVAVRMAKERADHDVVEYRHVLEGGRQLEGPPDADARMDLGRGTRDVSSIENDLARRDRHVAGKTIEECRLACAVWTDQSHDFTLFDGKIGAGNRTEAPERLGNIPCLKQHDVDSGIWRRTDAITRTDRPARNGR